MGVKVGKVAKCQRCFRRLRRRSFEESVAFTSAGQITAFVCSDCLSPEEFISSEVYDAMYETAFTTEGLVVSRPKTSEA